MRMNRFVLRHCRPVLLSAAMIKDSDKKQLGEERVFHLTLLNHSPKGSQWQPEIEMMEDQGFLAHSLASSLIGCCLVSSLT